MDTKPPYARDPAFEGLGGREREEEHDLSPDLDRREQAKTRVSTGLKSDCQALAESAERDAGPGGH
jgi:hypothetical protein